MTRWVLANAARFALVWVVAATVYEIALDPSGAPVAIFVVIVALVLFAPVLGLWLLIYLAASWWLGRVVPKRATRLVPVVLAPLLWLVLTDVDPAEVRWIAIATVVVFGLVAKPAPPSHKVGSWRKTTTS